MQIQRVATPAITIDGIAKKTGNAKIDAVLNGGTISWWHDDTHSIGTPNSTTGMSNARHTLTYSFMAAANSAQTNDNVRLASTIPTVPWPIRSRARRSGPRSSAASPSRRIREPTTSASPKAVNAISSGDGNDTVFLGKASSTVDCGTGTDTVCLPKIGRSKWDIQFDANTGTYTCRNGSITNVIIGAESIKGWNGKTLRATRVV